LYDNFMLYLTFFIVFCYKYPKDRGYYLIPVPDEIVNKAKGCFNI